HVLSDLDGHVDVILDGGPTAIGVESTVLDLTIDPPLVLRPGGVTLEALRACVPTVERFSAPLAMDDETARPASPGMLSKHYSPRAPVLLFSGPFEAVTQHMRQVIAERRRAGQRVGLLVPGDQRDLFQDFDTPLADLGRDLDGMAHGLFAGMRALDAQEVDVILARLVDSSGLGATINDRLLRAAEGRVIEVE
ncbi:MAG: Sua5/YciO/YrdC/YwlC family protein, partial [Anaerolineae bacterium]|nr:Sua5/YciO/YrdC/YwlC family protein [Anaerolineae bacterium]